MTPQRSGLAPAFVFTLLGVGILGIVSTFLPWFSYFDEGVNGWDAKELPAYYSLYSSGPLWTVLISGAAVLAAIVHLVKSNNKSPYKASERTTQSIGTLLTGIFLLINVGMQYNAFDEAAQFDGVFIEVGVGMQLAGIMGIALVVLGIVGLTVKSVYPVQQ